MTDHLYLAFEYNLKDILNLSNEIVEEVKRCCSGDVPNNQLSAFRIITSTKGNQILLEPFFGAASFSTHFAHKKYRADVNRVIVSIVDCLQLLSSNIEILFYTDGCREDVITQQRQYEISEIANLEKIPFQSRFIIKVPKVFYCSQVEFELGEPFEISIDQIASGYFCNYYICADSREQALEYIIVDSTLDILIGYQEINEILPISLPTELKGSFDVNEKGIFYKSGRVLF